MALTGGGHLAQGPLQRLLAVGPLPGSGDVHVNAVTRRVLVLVVPRVPVHEAGVAVIGPAVADAVLLWGGKKDNSVAAVPPAHMSSQTMGHGPTSHGGEC